MSCEEIQEALTERWLADRAVAPASRGTGSEDTAWGDHARTCASCAAHSRFLRALSSSLDTEVEPSRDRAVLARSHTRAARALRAHRPSRGFGRELVAAVVVLALGLPVAVAQAWLVAQGAAALLEPIVPHVVLVGLGVFYFGTFLLMVGALYAFVPLWVATVRRARMEVS